MSKSIEERAGPECRGTLLFGFIYSGYLPLAGFNAGRRSSPAAESGATQGQHTCLRHVHKVRGRKRIPAFQTAGRDRRKPQQPRYFERYAIRDDRRVITAVTR